jgi:hypothetical protein
MNFFEDLGFVVKSDKVQKIKKKGVESMKCVKYPKDVRVFLYFKTPVFRLPS